MRVYVVRKWPLRGRSHFACWNTTRVCLWLLCNVHFVRSTQSTISTWPRWPKGTHQSSSEEYRCTHVDACVARTWISYRCVPCHQRCTHRTSLVVRKKLFQFSCGCEQFHWGRSFGFLVINVCNHGEHYETPCIRTQTVPHGKRSSLQLYKTNLLMLRKVKSRSFSDPYKMRERYVSFMLNFSLLNLVVWHWPLGFKMLILDLVGCKVL